MPGCRHVLGCAVSPCTPVDSGAYASASEVVRDALTRRAEEQCARYLDLLEQTCEVIIAQNVRRARPVAAQRPQLLRWRCERHVVYLRSVRGGIELVRILHA